MKKYNGFCSVVLLFLFFYGCSTEQSEDVQEKESTQLYFEEILPAYSITKKLQEVNDQLDSIMRESEMMIKKFSDTNNWDNKSFRFEKFKLDSTNKVVRVIVSEYED